MAGAIDRTDHEILQEKLIDIETASVADAQRIEVGVTTWNAPDELADVRRRLNEILTKPCIVGVANAIKSGGEVVFQPPVSIYSTAESVTLHVPVPGYKADELSVEAESDCITISGIASRCSTATAVAELTTGMKLAGNFNIRVSLPAVIDPNVVKSTLADGALTLHLPKTERVQHTAVRVPVKPG